jgi:hypothetical protein
MGREFIPTLIQTVDYEALRWEFLGEELNDAFHKLAKSKDVEGISNVIKDWSEDFERRESETKGRIRDFLNDVGRAGGVVAVFDTLYQNVILAILDEFSGKCPKCGKPFDVVAYGRDYYVFGCAEHREYDQVFYRP